MDFFRESLGLQLIREPPEFVEVDPRPESEGMGDHLRRGIASGRGASPIPARIVRFTASLKGMPSSRARCFNSPRDHHRASESSA